MPYIVDIDRRYHLPLNKVAKLVDRPVPWGFGSFSEAMFYRTYSRERWDGRNERFWETVVRVVEGEFSVIRWHLKRMGIAWDESFWDSLAVRTADAIFNMQFLPPGRGLWAMGTKKVFEIGNAALNNCGYVEVRTLSKDAAWLMDHLMLGVGIGFSTYHLKGIFFQPLEGVTETYVIPDSREGWVESVRRCLAQYEHPNQPRVVFDYSRIRPKGTKIRGFGGTASGPEPLRQLHEKLVEIMDAQVNGPKRPNSILVMDVMNLIGRCVVAGNVRRSAEIALGKIDDRDFINAKDPEVFPERNDPVHGWSFLSNNSVVLEEHDEFVRLPDIVPGIERNGEPGFINLRNIARYGRFTEEKRDLATGANPCSEIPLESHELCCLVEVFPTRCADFRELAEVLELATLYAMAVSLMPSHDPSTNAVVSRNHRIGVSMSGLADWKDLVGVSQLIRYLRDSYRIVERVNQKYARMFGIPESVRLTTVKPSGTVSLLAGVSPGMHHPWDRWSLRRVRVDANSPVAERLIAAGVPNEPDITAPDRTLVFEFPVEYGHGRTRPQREVSAWEQLAFVAMLQLNWADNMVSNTITFQPHEAKDLSYMLATFAPLIKSTSVLPGSDDAHGYAQPPYERLTQAEYRRRKAEIGGIDWFGLFGSDGQESRYCEGDYCEL
jgi:ribonucleoside-diphosphate reductase alpha chain